MSKSATSSNLPILLSGSAALLLCGVLAAPGCTAEEEQEIKESTAVSEQQGTEEEQKAYSWLQTYGYAVADPATGAASFGKRLSEALLLYQEINKLPVDGTLNDATRELMATPRCSHPDTNLVLKKRGGPAARFSLESKWPTNYITYSHTNFTSDLPESTVKDALEVAGSTWSWANQALSFHLLDSAPGYISVEFRTGDHGDGIPFSGIGGIVAHTFSPGTGALAGDIHFDDDESWTNNGVGGPNIYAVAIHEMGHALGLNHSLESDSIMKPVYVNTIILGADDIDAVRHHYQPNAPVSMTTESQECRGWNEVQWTASAGATEYMLMRSLSSNFSNPTFVGTTTSTSMLVDVSPGSTWFFRVHACNQFDCGPLSSTQTSASYYTGPCD